MKSSAESRRFDLTALDLAEAICARPGAKLVRFYSVSKGERTKMHQEMFQVSDGDEFSVIRVEMNWKEETCREVRQLYSPEESLGCFVRAVEGLCKMEQGIIVSTRIHDSVDTTSLIIFKGGSWLAPPLPTALEIMISLNEPVEDDRIEYPVVPCSRVQVSNLKH